MRVDRGAVPAAEEHAGTAASRRAVLNPSRTWPCLRTEAPVWTDLEVAVAARDVENPHFAVDHLGAPQETTIAQKRNDLGRVTTGRQPSLLRLDPDGRSD